MSTYTGPVAPLCPIIRKLASLARYGVTNVIDAQNDHGGRVSIMRDKAGGGDHGLLLRPTAKGIEVTAMSDGYAVDHWTIARGTKWRTVRQFTVGRMGWL